MYWDFDYLQTMSNGIENIIKYGTNEGLVTGKIKSTNPFLSVEISSEFSQPIIETQLVGDYNLSNILTAVCIGKYFNVPDEKIKTAIENYSPSNSRSQLIKKDSNHIILDAYNANPTSMKAAIENFANIEASDKVLIIGGMMELGVESIDEHQKINQLNSTILLEQVVLVGGDFKKLSTTFFIFQYLT